MATDQSDGTNTIPPVQDVFQASSLMFVRQLAQLFLLVGTSVADDTPVFYDSIGSREVYWQAPRKRPWGMVFLLHGCSHSGGDFFICGNVKKCRGLPEQRRMARAAIGSGLLVASVSSGDRRMGGDRNRCFVEDDVNPTGNAIHGLRKRLELSDVPVFAVGASMGAIFVANLATHLNLLTAVSVQVTALPAHCYEDIKVRTVPLRAIEFTTMPHDKNTELSVAGNIKKFKAINITTQKRECNQIPLTPTYLFEETKYALDPISMTMSSKIYESLKNTGFLDKESKLIVKDPRVFDWKKVLSHANIPGFKNVATQLNNSTLEVALAFAWAHHEFCSTDIVKTYAFFKNVSGVHNSNVSSVALATYEKAVAVMGTNKYDPLAPHAKNEVSAIAKKEPKDTSCSSALLMSEFRSTTCRVPCKSYDSLLLLGAEFNHQTSKWVEDSMGGLENRMKVFAHLGIIAEATCAKLLVGPPCAHLDPMHNNGHKLKCSWHWDRYFDVRKFKHIPALVEMDSPPLLSNLSKKIYLPQGKDRKSTMSRIGKAFDIHSKGHAYALNFNLDEVWEIYNCLGQVDKQLRSQECGKTSFSPSLIATETADTIVRGYNRFVVLHLRRHDTVKLCDNSPKKVADFMRCQMGPSTATNFDAIIFFTNDLEDSYINDVRAELNTFAPWKVIQGDAEVISALKKGGYGANDIDNYLVYEVYKATAKKAQVLLSFGGHEDGQLEKCKKQTSCRK